jgi:hypothetical protein
MKKMNINIFDLSNYFNQSPCDGISPAGDLVGRTALNDWGCDCTIRSCELYRRENPIFAYNQEDWVNKITALAVEHGVESIIPWGEVRSSSKRKAYKDYGIENFRESMPKLAMHLKYGYFINKTIPDKIIGDCYRAFMKEIDLIRKKFLVMGELDSFNSYCNFSYDEFNSQLVTKIPESGVIKNPILNITKTLDEVKNNIFLPFFIDSTNPGKQIDFCRILIHYKYFSNSPVDIVYTEPIKQPWLDSADKLPSVCLPSDLNHWINTRIKQNNGLKFENPSLETDTIEKLCLYIKDKFYSNLKGDVVTNVFIDRLDVYSWWYDVSTFDDKSYYIRDIQIFEKKDNYYKDVLRQLAESKKVYQTIVEYKIKKPQLEFEDYRILLDKITGL